jgi:hypothetical protein
MIDNKPLPNQDPPAAVEPEQPPGEELEPEINESPPPPSHPAAGRRPLFGQ